MKCFCYIQWETAARKMVTSPHTAVGLMAVLDKARKTERDRRERQREKRKLLALLHRCTVM